MHRRRRTRVARDANADTRVARDADTRVERGADTDTRTHTGKAREWVALTLRANMGSLGRGPGRKYAGGCCCGYDCG